MDLFNQTPAPKAEPVVTVDPETILVRLVRIHYHLAEHGAHRQIWSNGCEWKRVALERIAKGKTTSAALFDPCDPWELRH